MEEYNYARQMMSMVGKYFDDTRDCKVLATGFNPGVYSYFDSTIDFKFFIIPDINYEGDNEPYDEQYKYIINGEPNVVLFRPDPYYTSYPKDMQKDIYEKLNNDYTFAGVVINKDGQNDTYVFVK